MTLLYSDNFDTDTTGALPAGSTSPVGSYQVQATALATSGANALVCTSGNAGDVWLAPSSANFVDGYVYIEQRFKPSTATGILYRMDSGYQNGYFFGAATTSGGFTGCNLFKRVSGNYSQINSVNFTPVTASAGDIIATELHAVGSTHELRIWNKTTGNTRPTTPQASFSDSTFPASGYNGLYAGSAGVNPVDNYQASDNNTAPTTTTINPNNSAIIYSPGNWTAATATQAVTNNPGAYFKVLVPSAPTLTFNVSANGSPTTKISWRMDGGAWNDSVVTASVATTIDSSTGHNLAAVPWHLLEVTVTSQSQNIDRWANTPPATAVVFTGMTFSSAGVTVASPKRLPGSILLIGDSLTEGSLDINSTAANDTDQNDSRLAWAWQFGSRSGLEFGIIGFGRQGWAYTGAGNVPALPAAISLQYAGVNRVWPADVVAVYVNMGTNDANAGNSDAVVQTAIGQFLTTVKAATSATIVLMRPFNGSKATAIQAGVTADTSGRVYYTDTAGVFDPSYGVDSSGYHPSGPNATGLVAPALQPLLSRYLYPRRFTISGT